MKKLVEKLNQAAKAYYNGQESPLTDKEYDALYDELLKMEKETGIILPDSPTQRARISDRAPELKKVAHEYPALSLDKTKDRDALKKWLGNSDRYFKLETGWINCSCNI